MLALYEDRAVLYGANGGEKASYDFGGSTLVDVDTENGGVALLDVYKRQSMNSTPRCW